MTPSSRPSNAPWRATQGRILAIAWPVMLSNITVPLLGLVDSAILGHLPEAHHLGAVTIGAQLFTMLCWSFGFLRMGTTACSARATSTHDAAQALRDSLWLALLLAVPVTLMIGQWLLPMVLPLMGASDLVEQGASTYLSIRVWSVPAIFIQYVILGWFIGQGITRVPLLLMTVTNVVNAVLDYLLVYGLDMTSDGVALGSVCADYTSLALGLWLVARHIPQTSIPWFGRFSGVQALAPMIRINQDLFIRTLLLLSVLGFFHAQGAQQSDVILAANGLLITLLLLIANALDGFAHAAESLIGQALAKKKFDQLPTLIRLTGLNSLLMALLLSLLFLALNDQLWWWLTNNNDVLRALQDYQLYLLVLPLVGVGSFWVDGLCIGSGSTRTMRNVMLVSVGGVFFPAWYLSQALGNHGLWISFFLLLIARAVLAGHIVRGLWCNPGQYAPL